MDPNQPRFTGSTRSQVPKKDITNYDDAGVPYPIEILSNPMSLYSTKYNLQWKIPKNGGSPITSYTIRYREVTVKPYKTVNNEWQLDEPVLAYEPTITLDNGALTTYEVRDLGKNRYYLMEIQANNKEGAGAKSSFIIKTKDHLNERMEKFQEEGENQLTTQEMVETTFSRQDMKELDSAQAAVDAVEEIEDEEATSIKEKRMTRNVAIGTIAAVGGGVAAIALTPVIIGAAGFTGAGIAAGSVAAKMMSAAAIANGGGVAAGGGVATLQSIGAAGLGLTGTAVCGSVGSAFGYAGSLVFRKK